MAKHVTSIVSATTQAPVLGIAAEDIRMGDLVQISEDGKLKRYTRTPASGTIIVYPSDGEESENNA